MKFKPTQVQLHAQAQANRSLFETEAQGNTRQASAQVQHQAKKAIAPVQDRVTFSETREFSVIKDVASNSAAYRVAGWEHMNFQAYGTFGAEAGSLRQVVRCDVDGVCL